MSIDGALNRLNITKYILRCVNKVEALQTQTVISWVNKELAAFKANIYTVERKSREEIKTKICHVGFIFWRIYAEMRLKVESGARNKNN